MGEAMMRCEACDAIFPRREVRVDARDDWRCPVCASLRLCREPTRWDQTRDLMLDYHRL